VFDLPSRWRRYDQQPALGHRQIAQDRRQRQLLDRRDLRLDRPQHDPHPPLLHEGVDPEAADAARTDRVVDLLLRLELRGLPVVHKRAGQFDRVLRRERHARHRRDPAVDLEGRRELRGEEEVRAIAADHQPQQVMQEFRCLFAFHRCPSVSASQRVPGRRVRRGNFP
jgi:hypothetical protein